MNLRSLIERMDEIESSVVEQAVANPYQGADAEKFAKMSPADQAWLTKGGGIPDINDQFILARAPNKGQPVQQPVVQQPPAQSGQSAVDNTALLAKLKQLEQLVDQYNALKSKNESVINLEQSLVESFGYQYDLGYLTEQDAAAISRLGNVDFGKFLQGGKDLAKGIVKRAATPIQAAYDAKAAYDEIQALDKNNMSKNEYSRAVTRIVSQLIASIGLFWAGAILGALAGSPIFGVGAIAGFIAGGVGGIAADYVLGDDLESIVDALVDKLYNNTDTNQQAVTPTPVDQEPPSASSAVAGKKPVVGDEDVIALQTILKNDGYDLGTYGPNSDGIDGKIGPKTISAIQQDLAKLGATNSDGSPLAVTGSINSDTSQAIQQYYLS